MTEPEAALVGAIGAALEITDADGSHQCHLGTHSRVADGRQLCWRPSKLRSASFAVDAEIITQPVPPALRARLAAAVETAEFWRRWTRAEVCAKLFDVPIVVWVRRHGLPDQSLTRLGGQRVHLVTTAVDDLAVTYGMRVTT